MDVVTQFLTDTWLLWVLVSVGGFLYVAARDSEYYYYVFQRYLLALGTLVLVSA